MDNIDKYFSVEELYAQTGVYPHSFNTINKLIWLKENTRYEKHEEDKALPQPANLTYELRSGDCDDLSYLYISLCRAVGIPARLIRGFLIKEDINGSVNVFPHAWTEVFVGGNLGDNGWIPVECAGSGGSVKADVHQNFGLEDCFHLRLFVDDGSNESLNISSSGPQVFYEQGMQVDMFSFAMITGYESLLSKKLVVTKNNIRSYT